MALRLANDAAADPLTGKPFSSRHVAECLVKGSEIFGWARRTMAPGSMRAPDGSLVGWGVAIGTYKAAMAPAISAACSGASNTLAACGAGQRTSAARRSTASTAPQIRGL